ncbi:thioredoxin [Streptococcus parauberis]|uniref:thioredoxin n=1 Tax=Streptococcus parauberis TaxID=1348 RepID=UPI0028918957|nr:thioredoxin [Streptococcus parauberis]MDT2749616.1 thioredoxin [Streptococcus parauberis]
MKKIFRIYLLLYLLFVLFLSLKSIEQYLYFEQYEVKKYRNSELPKVNYIFYKKNCRYCKLGQREIFKRINTSEIESYIIDIDSPIGKKMVKKYHVRYAPTFVKVRESNVTSFLYAFDKNNEIVIDIEKIRKAFSK